MSESCMHSTTPSANQAVTHSGFLSENHLTCDEQAPLIWQRPFPLPLKAGAQRKPPSNVVIFFFLKHI